MATRVLIDARHRHRGEAYVSINPKLERLLIYKGAFQLMSESYGQEFESVQLRLDDDQPGLFWLKPCDKDADGARNLHKSSKTTRILSIRLLLRELNWDRKETARFSLGWDSEEEAAVVDTRPPKKE